jgi:hypothetical protein
LSNISQGFEPDFSSSIPDKQLQAIIDEHGRSRVLQRVQSLLNVDILDGNGTSIMT